MLGSLTGQITARLDQRILVEVSDIGYWVHTGSWQPDGLVTCFLYHQVREDAQVLYGFENLQTLRLFEQLISVNGVGPKAALALLSIGPIDRVSNAITTADSAFLSLAPGIGQKAAQKVILELKGKLETYTVTGDAALHADVRAALESLGYKTADIMPILGKIPKSVTTADAQIKWVLQNL
jgi:Holliday junction DNA helicase RuvA